jgi:hypothetical protein
MAEGVGVCYGGVGVCYREGKGCTTALPKLVLPCCLRAKGTTPLHYCWGVGVKEVCVAVEMFGSCGLLCTLKVDQ